MLDFVHLETKKGIKYYEVIVCGGGPAGFAAAVSSARCGAKTLLIERGGCLGGIWTTGLLCWILDIKNKSSEGILKEMFSELSQIGAGKFLADGLKFACDVEEMKHYLEQKCVKNHVALRYHSMVCGAEVDDKKIEYITVCSKSGVEKFSAKVYIDATGDGDLGAITGCKFRVGDARGETQPMSLIALLGGIDIEQIKYMNNSISIPDNNPKKSLLSEMNRAGIDPTYKEPTLMQISDDGIFALMSNHEYGVSACDEKDITEATIKARHEIYETVKALKALGGAWKNVHLLATGDQIGVREGRRIEGHYYLTKSDVFKGSKFEDAICDVGNKVDIHSPRSEEGGGVVKMKKISNPYQIPMRSLIAKDNDSLLMAGRCISGDFYAHSTFRLTGNAVATGSAAGILAAVAVKEGRLPKDITFQQFCDIRDEIWKTKK